MGWSEWKCWLSLSREVQSPETSVSQIYSKQELVLHTAEGLVEFLIIGCCACKNCYALQGRSNKYSKKKDLLWLPNIQTTVGSGDPLSRKQSEAECSEVLCIAYFSLDIYYSHCWSQVTGLDILDEALTPFLHSYCIPFSAVLDL